MESWIYIKSNHIFNILSLAIALSHSKQKWNIIRSTSITPFMELHPNVNKIGFATADDNIITLTSKNGISLLDCVNHYLKELHENELKELNDFDINYSIIHRTILERIKENKNIFLILTEEECKEQTLNLYFIDEFCRLISNKGYNIASLGDESVPCINGTDDLRGLLSYPELISALKNAPCVISNNNDITQICNNIGVPAFLIAQKEDMIFCNDTKMQFPNHMLNIIIRQLQ